MEKGAKAVNVPKINTKPAYLLLSIFINAISFYESGEGL
jgi:hypothetical protein